MRHHNIETSSSQSNPLDEIVQEIAIINEAASQNIRQLEVQVTEDLMTVESEQDNHIRTNGQSPVSEDGKSIFVFLSRFLFYKYPCV